ncbi:uncharacterized protein VDAG_03533 [Verticillium dahliae VdLs.17]|uniref:BZIP domain-containing protein n=1 Tax=Verticillium dahliae (strain VdLs.17 / ATCC MYA-4575 / FGSC 10137) TaxID=498257 RepID=G2WZU1_VERDV|nr:uncharacterized protein VDAG_03533 [Verticillium dahliae VdLs.17]EGY22093.1 hypothetical protein VDAG_03533 [Verticillium dahliae VdLs.17]KAH6703941.1 hypothetical protein EV126DRAFT_417411 [Verticillium dahliae]
MNDSNRIQPSNARGIDPEVVLPSLVQKFPFTPQLAHASPYGRPTTRHVQGGTSHEFVHKTSSEGLVTNSSHPSALNAPIEQRGHDDSALEDEPHTTKPKRKNDNGSVPRASRERRAARVGELEERLRHVKEVHEKDEAGRQKRLHNLKLELQAYKSKCEVLENLLQRERQDRVDVERNIGNARERERSVGCSSSPSGCARKH